MSNDEREVLVELQNLDEFFKIGKNKILKAVEDVSFKIYRASSALAYATMSFKLS